MSTEKLIFYFKSILFNILSFGKYNARDREAYYKDVVLLILTNAFLNVEVRLPEEEKVKIIEKMKGQKELVEDIKILEEYLPKDQIKNEIIREMEQTISALVKSFSSMLDESGRNNLLEIQSRFQNEVRT